MKKSVSIFVLSICCLFINAQPQSAAISAKNHIKNSALKQTLTKDRDQANRDKTNDRKKSFLIQSAQQTALWQQTTKDGLQPDAPLSALELQDYLVFQLNKTVLKEILAQVPAESKNTDEGKSLTQDNPIIMELPMADGTFARFSVEESSVLEPDLAARFPEIKSYRGQGVDDPTLTTRFDWTPQGFHALILSGGEVVNVEPANGKDSSLYVIYNGDAIQEKALDCLVEDFDSGKSGMSYADASNIDAPQIAVGGTLRNYRIAIAADFEYTQTYGGNTVAGTISSINTWLNGANTIYEKELSIHLNLVNNTTIIYSADNGFNTSSDPYDNSNVGTMLSNALGDIDAKVGRANYDVGHVFGTAPAGYLGSGVAYIGIVNNNSNLKGGGATQFGSSLGNSGALGVWVHEIGHQFGANHNFNGSQANCGVGQHNNATSFETGSGSTIMAYSGICASDNVTNSRDMRFHPMSYFAINNYINSSASNFTPTSTGNSAPNVNGGGNRYIPKNTPFTLTAIGSDPNGDNLTYSWDEIDAGGASYPQDGTDASYNDTNDPVGTTRPIFRSFAPVSSPSRTFPSLTYILNNANDAPNTSPSTGLKTAEELPRVGRTLNFRVTARDNRTGGGGVNEDTVALSVDNASGPFLVTTPNTNLTLPGGSLQVVTWSVNNTNLPPISATNVKISLSTDSGVSFPTVLAASTLNDGSEIVTIPNITTSTARIKVEAVGNVFFDINDSNFAIAATTAPAPTYEADLQSRPGGNGVIDSDDVQQLRRFSVGLDLPYVGTEFQRADCSPSSTSGDGFVDADDIQQARIYTVSGIKQTTGGPLQSNGLLFEDWNSTGKLQANVSTVTDVRAETTSATAGRQITVPIRVDADGSEAGFTFSLGYDATKLSNPVVTIGSAGGSIMTNITAANPNANPIGFSLTSFNSGTTLAAGANQLLVNVRFTVAANAPAGATNLTFESIPSRTKVSGTDPNTLRTQPTFTDGIMMITAAPTAGVSVGGRVTTAAGRGIGGVVIVMMDAAGVNRTAITTSFGYYHFAEVAAGETYVFTARSKHYTFSQALQVLSIIDDSGAVNFVAAPTSGLKNSN